MYRPSQKALRPQSAEGLLTDSRGHSPVIASNFRRLMAFVVDGSMTYVSFGAALLLTRSIGVALRTWFYIQVLAIAHFVSTGTTLGKKLLGIRQVQARETLGGHKQFQRVGVLLYLFNVLAVRPVISSFTLGLSLIWPLFDPHGQFLADKLLGVYTVTADSLEHAEAYEKKAVAKPTTPKAKL